MRIAGAQCCPLHCARLTRCSFDSRLPQNGGSLVSHGDAECDGGWNAAAPLFVAARAPSRRWFGWRAARGHVTASHASGALGLPARTRSHVYLGPGGAQERRWWWPVQQRPRLRVGGWLPHLPLLRLDCRAVRPDVRGRRAPGVRADLLHGSVVCNRAQGHSQRLGVGAARSLPGRGAVQ